MRRPSTIRILLWFVLVAQPGLTRSKTDTVTLVNGNQLTCEIRGVSRGVLTAKTDSLSTVSIRWEDVAGIRSKFTFEIILSDGSSHFGVLNPDPAGGLLVAGTATIPLGVVVSLIPIESRFANRFNGALDLGYSFLKSKATSQLNFDGEVDYTTRRRSLGFRLSDNLVVRQQTTTTRRTQADLAFDQTLPGRYVAKIIGQFSGNSELNLLQRYLGGGALGRHLVRTNRSIFSIYGGGAYSAERYSGGERRNNGEALLGLNSQIFRLYSPKLEITGDFRLWPNLTTSGRFRIDANAKARIEIYKNLFVSFSFFDNYDRKNPTKSSHLNDYGVVTSVGYSFNR